MILRFKNKKNRVWYERFLAFCQFLSNLNQSNDCTHFQLVPSQVKGSRAIPSNQCWKMSPFFQTTKSQNNAIFDIASGKGENSLGVSAFFFTGLRMRIFRPVLSVVVCDSVVGTVPPMAFLRVLRFFFSHQRH